MLPLFFSVWIIFNGRITLEITLFGVGIAGLMFAFICRFMDYSMEKERNFYKKVLKDEGYLVDICLIYAMISFLAVVVLSRIYTGVY